MLKPSISRLFFLCAAETVKICAPRHLPLATKAFIPPRTPPSIHRIRAAGRKSWSHRTSIAKGQCKNKFHIKTCFSVPAQAPRRSSSRRHAALSSTNCARESAGKSILLEIGMLLRWRVRNFRDIFAQEFKMDTREELQRCAAAQ